MLSCLLKVASVDFILRGDAWHGSPSSDNAAPPGRQSSREQGAGSRVGTQGSTAPQHPPSVAKAGTPPSFGSPAVPSSTLVVPAAPRSSAEGRLPEGRLVPSQDIFTFAWEASKRFLVNRRHVDLTRTALQLVTDLVQISSGIFAAKCLPDCVKFLGEMLHDHPTPPPPPPPPPTPTPPLALALTLTNPNQP